MKLIFITVANDEGLVMAEVGDCPGEDFAAYSSSLMEAAQNVTESGALGEQVCSAVVLKSGRMLIMHEARVDDHPVYLSILCSRVPAGVQKLIKSIVTCIARALLGNKYREHHVE